MLHRTKWLLMGTALMATLGISACQGESEQRAPEHKAAPPPEQPKPALFARDTMDREAVVLAVLDAATAAALGRDDRKAQRELEGRKFAVRIRFGCPGITDPDRMWTYDAEKHVLRAKVKSNVTDEALPASDLLGKGYQGGVGFIVGKPWLLSAGCSRGAFESAAGGELTIIIAQLFTDSDSRGQRPQQSYELTKQVKPDEQPSDGLDFVLSGRLSELADGRPIHCAATDGPPACIVSAKIDRVAIENPATRDILREWGPGAGSQ